MAPTAANLGPPDEVASLAYEVADKALSSQASQWQDVRGRVATLVTIGPAAAAVIVAATNATFDVLAGLSLGFLIIAILASIRALYPGTNFSPSVTLQE